MRYVAMLGLGPAWLPGKPVAEQDRSVIGAHLYWLRQGYDKGVVLFGGPFVSGFGGVVLLEAASQAEATTFMDNDPAVAAGLLSHRVEQVRVIFDALAGKAWEIAAPA